MVYYFIKFRLANDKKVDSVQLDSSGNKEMFECAMKDFNSAGAVARTYKRIVKQVVNSSTIDIILEVKERIPSPTMCFRNYSKFILEHYNDTVGQWVTTSGNFLKGIEVKEVNSNEFENIIENNDSSEMTDKEMIKAIIDLCMDIEIGGAEEKKKRNWTINKIKNIVREYYR